MALTSGKTGEARTAGETGEEEEVGKKADEEEKEEGDMEVLLRVQRRP